MKRSLDQSRISAALKSLTATDLMIPLSEYAPDATYGAIPLIDQQDALEAYPALQDGSLPEAPTS